MAEEGHPAAAAVDLRGRAAVVTGASSGLGRAIAVRLGQAGMDVWLVGRSAAALDETAAMTTGGRAHVAAMDITQPGMLAELIASIDHPDVHAVVNCAGVFYPEAIAEADPARWREMFAINLFATMESCQAAVRRFRRQGSDGHIVNFSSLAARWDAGGAYGASKIAVEMIGRSLRKELERDNIRVTTIVPGGFATGLGRDLPPAAAAAFGDAIAATGATVDRVLGDPDHVARIVRQALEQPSAINLAEVVIRPPVELVL